MPLKPIRDGAAIHRTEIGHITKRQYMVWWKPDHPIFTDTAVHANCECNEYIALRNRVLQAVPPTTVEGVRICKPIASAIAAYLGKHRPSQGEWIQQYGGSKRTRYLNAKAHVEAYGLLRKDGYLNSFVKPERLMDATKDPRLIQARNAKYNYALGNYLKPVEHLLYNVHGSGPLKPWLPSGRLIAKGLCQRRRAQLLHSKMQEFRSPLVLSLDCSRFDAHVSPEMLNLEHSIYLKCYDNEKDLRKLLSWQMHNVGFTQRRIRYKCKGGRSSGDMNTALGNCVLMIIMVAAAMKEMGFRSNEWQMLDDGDDCLLIIEEFSEPRVAAITEIFRDFGHELKLENRALIMEKVVFCQSQPIYCADGWRFVRNPTKSLNTTFVGIRHYQHRKAVRKLAAQIGDCELALTSGVPIMGAFAEMLIRVAGDCKVPVDRASSLWIKASRERRYLRNQSTRQPVTWAARESFDLAFGMDSQQQVFLESWFESLTPADIL